MTDLRPIGSIAQDIVDDFVTKRRETGKPMPPFVRAYVQPMVYLTSMTDSYGYDDAETVVIYALSNLSGYRGTRAKALKDELRTHLHRHNPGRYKAPK